MLSDEVGRPRLDHERDFDAGRSERRVRRPRQIENGRTESEPSPEVKRFISDPGRPLLVRAAVVNDGGKVRHAASLDDRIEHPRARDEREDVQLRVLVQTMRLNEPLKILPTVSEPAAVDVGGDEQLYPVG